MGNAGFISSTVVEGPSHESKRAWRGSVSYDVDRAIIIRQHILSTISSDPPPVEVWALYIGPIAVHSTDQAIPKLEPHPT